jgi:serine/threonine protein kinase
MNSVSSAVASPAKDLLNAIKNRWREGVCPDAAVALAEHPELHDDKIAVVDLAYEAYWLRRAEGEQIDIDAYCAQFPQCRSSLLVSLVSSEAAGNEVSLFNVYDGPPLPTLAAGDKLGDFTILRELGCGGLARVYLATEASEGDRPVAVKLSRTTNNEARTLGRLDHDNIVPILWAGPDESSGLHVVCMPFLGSATLLDVLDHAHPRPNHPPPKRGEVITEAIRKAVRPGDPSPDRSLGGPDLSRRSFVDGVLRLGEQIADALTFLRQRRLVHCDLKPSNVLLTPTGRPLVLDFNLALAGNVPGVLIGGTFQYMAPEQIRAWMGGARISVEEGGQADLYSLGVILYELLTGQHLLAGSPRDLKDVELAQWVLERQKQGFRPVRELNPAVPRRIARLLHRCLSPDPNARPAGAAALAAELRRHRRRLLQPMLMAAGCVLLLLGAALATTAAVTPPPIRPAVHRAAAEEHLMEAWQLLKDGQPDEAEEQLQQADHSFAQAIDAHVHQGRGKHGPWQDYASRGRVKMLLGQLGEEHDTDFTEAQTLFLEADRLLSGLPADEQPPKAQAAVVWACLSYCYSRKGQHPVAVVYGEKALKASFRPSALLNNLGFGCLIRKDFDQAESYLAEALGRDPKLLPALRNKTLLALERCLWRQQAGEWESVPPWVVHELDHAIPERLKHGSSEPASLYMKAASVSVGRGDTQQARKYLSEAFRLGARLKELQSDPIFGNDNELVGWLRSFETATPPKSPAGSIWTVFLADPLASPLP